MSDPRDITATRAPTLSGALLTMTSDAVLIVSPHHLAETVNTAFVHRTGYTLEELQGKPWTKISEGRDGEGLLEEVEAALSAGERWQRTLWIRRRKGEVLQVAVSVSPIDASEGRYLVVLSDPGEARLALGRDPLTGLRDSSHVWALLSQRLGKARGGMGLKPLLLMVAVDRFTAVNARLGWTTADRALHALAQRLRDRVGSQGVVARVAGDRFVVLHHGIEDNTEAGAWAETLLEHLAAPLTVNGHTLALTASIGVAISPDDSTDVDGLMRRLELATRLAKQGGGNNWRRAPMHTPAFGIPSLSGLDELRVAMRSGQFELYYQPRVRLKTGHIVAVEGSLRWQHPRRGSLEARDFSALVEGAGLGIELGDQALRAGAEQLARWREQGRSMLVLSLPLTQAQLLDEWLIDRLDQALEANDLPADAIELSLEAATFFSEHPRLIPALGRLGERGVRLALENFGPHAMSLEALISSPLSALKTDTALIHELSEEGASQLLEAVVSVARVADLQVIGAGVESPEQLELLRELGLNQAQGYSFGRPMPVREVSLLLGRRRRQ